MVTPDERSRGAVEFSSGVFDLGQWDDTNPDVFNRNTTFGDLYPGVPGYGTISHDEDWYDLGFNIPLGHYSLTVKEFVWDNQAPSSGSISHLVSSQASTQIFFLKMRGLTLYILHIQAKVRARFMPICLEAITQIYNMKLRLMLLRIIRLNLDLHQASRLSKMPYGHIPLSFLIKMTTA